MKIIIERKFFLLLTGLSTVACLIPYIIIYYLGFYLIETLPSKERDLPNPAVLFLEYYDVLYIFPAIAIFIISSIFFAKNESAVKFLFSLTIFHLLAVSFVAVIVLAAAVTPFIPLCYRF